MNKNTGTSGTARPHIDTLRVVHGYAIAFTAVETIRRRTEHRSDHRDDASAWLFAPAGRGA